MNSPPKPVRFFFVPGSKSGRYGSAEGVISSRFVMRFSLIFVLPLALGCATRYPQNSVTKMGTPRPARADDCALTLVTQSDTWPGGKYDAYESVGMVNIYARSTNAEPGDPDVKKELKPRACALGGELIAVISSTGLHNRYGKALEGRQISFQVLAKKQSQETTY